MLSPHRLTPFLPGIVPVAAAWAALMERKILKNGVPLNDEEREAARAMGVREPGRVRVLAVDQVPVMKGSFLDWAGRKTGLLSPHISGMCLRYGILVRKEYLSELRLIAHECVHVAQYERLGGMRPFLAVYLRECLELGYFQSPLELEAIEKAQAYLP